MKHRPSPLAFHEFTFTRLLKLDESSQHLSITQFARALALAVASGIVWGLITRSMFVGWATVGTQLFQAWRTPAANERFWPRAAFAILWGGWWAGVWWFFRHFGPSR